MKERGNFTPMASWEGALEGENRATLEALLPDYLRSCRWFGGKARDIAGLSILEAVPVPGEEHGARIANVRVSYTEGEAQTYVLPLNFAPAERAMQLQESVPQAIIARLNVAGQEGVLYDGTWDADFARLLLEAIKGSRESGSGDRTLVGWPTRAFERVLGPDGKGSEPRVMRAEQSNTSVAYGNRAILKMFRRLEEGTSPDLEIGRFLGERGFTHTPPLAGALEYRRGEGEPQTLATLQGFVPNLGDAWQYTLASLDSYLDYALAEGVEPPDASSTNGGRSHLLDMADEDVPEPLRGALGPYLDSARLLGRRTAEMHLALASDPNDPAFAPEPFTPGYLRGLYDSVRELSTTAFGLLRNNMAALPEETRAAASEVISSRSSIMDRFQPLLQSKLQATRLRCHGDYHLGQVLYTGSDFVIIDFEGEPVRSLRERRLKHSPLKDVAGMLRSFHYAAYAALFARIEQASTPGAAPTNSAPSPQSLLVCWADEWHRWVGAAFLREYLHGAEHANFLPRTREDLRTLLDIYLLEKAIYELIYELNNRPDWVRIPLQGIREQKT